MKPFVKYALASIALVGATSAYADVTLPSTGNGELAIFVRDLSAPTRVFMSGLGVTLDDLLTQDEITNTPGLAADLRNGVPINVSKGLTGASFNSSALATFMSQASGLGYEYAIIGGDNVGGNSVADAWRFIGTNETQFSAANVSTTTNTQINNTSGLGNVMDGFFADENALLNGGSFITNSTFGQDGFAGSQAPTFFGANFGDDTAKVGTATNLYMLTSGGSSTGKARIYQFADITLNSDGTLTSASVGGPQVPLPAAVWLLGSALVGLGTVRRRRNAEVAA